MITIKPVTPDQAAALVAELRANKSTVVELTTPLQAEFRIEGHGIGADATLKEFVLQVNVTHKPFFVTESAVEAGLRRALGPTFKSA